MMRLRRRFLRQKKGILTMANPDEEFMDVDTDSTKSDDEVPPRSGYDDLKNYILRRKDDQRFVENGIYKNLVGLI